MKGFLDGMEVIGASHTFYGIDHGAIHGDGEMQTAARGAAIK